MNINEHMSELGKIGATEYSTTDAVVDNLVGRTRRTRGRRQVMAALAGSVGAVTLGVIAAQVFVGLGQNDAGMRDRNFDNDYGYLELQWSDRYGPDYTGLGVTQDEYVAAWKSVQAQAAIVPQEVAPAGQPKTETATCAYEEREWNGGTKWRGPNSNCEWVFPDEPKPEVPDGSFLFGNGHVYVCGTWTDAATGVVSRGNWSGTAWGWEKKAIICDPGDKYWYSYKYMGDDATWSGSTCVGDIVEYKGAPHQLSCLESTYKVMNNSAYGWSTAHSWYYLKTSPPAGYQWNGSDFVLIPPDPDPTPTPTPTPTETTPPPAEPTL